MSFSAEALSFVPATGEGSGNGERGGCALHLTDDRVSLVAAGESHFRAEAVQAADTAGIEDLIFVQGDAKVVRQFEEGGVLRDAVLTGIERGVEHKDGVATTFDEFLQGIHDGLWVVDVRTGDHDDVALLGDLGLLEQVDGLRLVVVLFEEVLGAGVAVAAGLVDAMLARAGNEAGGLLPLFENPNQGTGQFLFTEAGASWYLVAVRTSVVPMVRTPYWRATCGFLSGSRYSTLSLDERLS